MNEREYTDAEVEEALRDSPASRPSAWKRVRTPYAGAPSEAVSIRLPREVIVALRSEAVARGIGHTELARMFIIEGLKGSSSAVADLERRVERIEAALVAERRADYQAKPEGSDREPGA